VQHQVCLISAWHSPLTTPHYLSYNRICLQFIFPNAMGHPVTAIVKTLLDQVIMAPAGIGLFFTALGVLEGKSTGQVRDADRSTGWETAYVHV
jgi:hypothetical protein